MLEPSILIFDGILEVLCCARCANGTHFTIYRAATLLAILKLNTESLFMVLMTHIL